MGATQFVARQHLIRLLEKIAIGKEQKLHSLAQVFLAKKQGIET